jgi:hypothetical protein
LKTYDDLRAETETLYFDGPHAEDWLAFARRGDEYLPALDGQHILVPNQVQARIAASLTSLSLV